MTLGFTYIITKSGEKGLKAAITSFCILVTIFSLSVIVSMILQTFSIIRLYFRPNVYHDITLEAPPIPESSQFAADTLKSLGFQRIGERRIDLLGGQGKTIWLFSTPDFIIQGRIVRDKIPPNTAVSFTSYVGEKGLLETIYPYPGFRAKWIEKEGHSVNYNFENIEGAYRLHVSKMAEFEQKNGKAVQIKRIHDLEYWDRVYDQNYKRDSFKFHWDYVGMSLFLFVLGILLIWSTGRAVFNTHYNKPFETFILSFAINFVVMISIWVLSIREIQPNQREKETLNET